MKKISTSILLNFLVFSLFAQDYCPCEDQTYGEEENFLTYTSSTDFFMDFSKQKTTTSYSIVVVETNVETETFESKNSTEKKSSAVKKQKAKKKKLKGSTWTFKRPLKRQRKFKKYSGQCPTF